MSTRNISFIGAGNVAEALCLGLTAAGHRIISIASQGGDSARVLAGATGAVWRRDLSVPDNCDILILAVNDTSVVEVAREVNLPERTVIVHTAGSVPLDALGRNWRAGVFYPLQTFTKGFVPEMRKVPFFIEATDKPALNLLRELATDIGAGAWDCDTERRRHLHVAAVFANNFSNFMMTTGEAIATEAGFDPSLLRPLMEETVRKALRTGPERARTSCQT
jgi:predicted short-subunit dehydrogenase-like oxidoreductase (DUF2520 family)